MKQLVISFFEEGGFLKYYDTCFLRRLVLFSWRNIKTYRPYHLGGYLIFQRLHRLGSQIVTSTREDNSGAPEQPSQIKYLRGSKLRPI